MNLEHETAAGSPDDDLPPVAGELALAAAVGRGEREAREALCRDLLEPVYAFVFWRVGGNRQDAEDVTQETFLTALASIARFEGRSSLYVWICGIAKNLAHARNRLRERHERPHSAGADEECADVGPDQRLEQAETERLVGLALTELPPHYQRFLREKYVEKRSFAEMAVSERCSAKAVESTVQRAKRALAQACARLGIGRLAGAGGSDG